MRLPVVCENIGALHFPGVGVHRKILCALLALLAPAFVPAASESSVPVDGPSSSVLRNRVGANAPCFDDSARLETQSGALPSPAHHSDGFSQCTTRLSPLDRLTFLSDRVGEAPNSEGEFFVFDRSRGMSIQSAEEIAHAVQDHGQQDDITVLARQFATAEVLHA